MSTAINTRPLVDIPPDFREELGLSKELSVDQTKLYAFLQYTPSLSIDPGEKRAPDVNTTSTLVLVEIDLPTCKNINEVMSSLYQVQNALSLNRSQSVKQQIETNEQRTNDLNQEAARAREESMQKLEQAKKSGTWSQAFKWIGVGVSVVVGVVACASGIGAVAGAFLIASTVASVGSEIFTAAGGMEKLEEKMGPEGAQGVMWGMMGVQVALGVATMGVGFASSSGAIASNVPRLAAVLSKQIPSALNSSATVLRAANVAKVVGQGISGGATIAEAGANVGASVNSYGAQQKQADATEMKGSITELDASTKNCIRLCQKLFGDMNAATDWIFEVIHLGAKTNLAIINRA